jgi:hypothetical protein
MTEAESEPVLDLRRALAQRDHRAAAELLPRIRVALAVADDQPRVARDGDRRLLPVFLSMASWEAFDSTDDVRLLEPVQLLTLLEQLPVDAVLFDPALPDAVEVPTADVMALLRGEFPGEDGTSRVAGRMQFAPDPAWTQQVREVLSGLGVIGEQAWAVQRVSSAGTTPTVAVSSRADDAELQDLIAALQGADGLPASLEVIRLDDAATEQAEAGWEATRVAVQV